MLKGFPLSGLRVVEVGEGWVGPWAGLLLADLGAEVIKIESLTRMDMTRGPAVVDKSAGHSAIPTYPDGIAGDRPWNRNAQFNAGNFGKYDVTLDLTRAKGLQILMKLVAGSDVFMTNTALGVAEKLGITYETIAKVNPEIIYLTSTGYGRTGPYASRVAMGNPIDAAAGLFGLRDYGDGDGTAVAPDTHADCIAAATNVLAITMALYKRAGTGKGMFVESSMVEASMLHIGEAIMDYTINQRVQHSPGNRDISMIPQGCYRCQGKDEWITLSIRSDEEWQRFVGVTGDHVLAEERFNNVLGRIKHQDEIDGRIQSWTVNRAKLEVMDFLTKKGITAGAVLNNAEVYADPNTRERNFWNVIEDPDAGVRTYPGRLWKLEETEVPPRAHSPCLGEHNDFILGGLLGLTKDEIDELKREYIIGTTPLGATGATSRENRDAITGTEPAAQVF